MNYHNKENTNENNNVKNFFMIFKFLNINWQDFISATGNKKPPFKIERGF